MSPETMDALAYQQCYDTIESAALSGYWHVQAFDVSHWYRGATGHIFTANHHIATVRTILRRFAPHVTLNGVQKVLNEHNVVIQAHIAVLLKFLLLHDNFVMTDLFDDDDRCFINMDSLFQDLRSRYSN